MLETRSVYAVDLEVRQVGERPTITGRFPYNSLATTSNTGRRRKERFAPKAFEFVLSPNPPKDRDGRCEDSGRG